MNNPTLCESCFTMIGRADIEESKSNVAVNAWLPQTSYPCGNFSDTSSFTSRRTRGSIGHAFAVRNPTEKRNQISLYPYTLHEVSVLVELILGHPRYLLADVPPQPNSPSSGVPRLCFRNPQTCLYGEQGLLASISRGVDKARAREAVASINTFSR